MKTRLVLLSAAFAGLSASLALADPPPPPSPPRPMTDLPRIDADRDGFVTRAEAQTAASQMFDRLDENRDGKLDANDRRERRVILQRQVRGDRDVTVDESVTEKGEHGVHREVRRHVIVKDGDDRGRHGHRGSHGPPMGLMIFANAGEADVNGDGAISRQEHIAQHLRFYDAADVNGDGKIQFDPPPMPPVPPAAVQPPEAPPAPPPPPRR